MTRLLLKNGDVFSDVLANSAGTPRLDGSDEYGSGPKVIDDWLDDSPSQIKARFYSWYNRIQVTEQTGLAIAYTGASVLLPDGSQVALSPGQLTLPANTSSFVFVNDSGSVTHATSLPSLGIALALAITDAGSITSLVDLRYQTNEQVGVIGGLSSGGSNGVFDIGDIKQSSRQTPSVGWAKCDNALYNDADYPLAASAIGRVNSLPSDPVGTFRAPGIADKVVVGASSTRPIGSTEGTDGVSLSTANLPRHTHGINDPGHSHGADSEHGHNTNDPGHGHPVLASFEGGRNDESLITRDAAVAGTTKKPFGYSTETFSNKGQRIIQKQPTDLRVLSGSANVRIDKSSTNLSIREAGQSQPISIRQPGIALAYYVRLF